VLFGASLPFLCEKPGSGRASTRKHVEPFAARLTANNTGRSKDWLLTPCAWAEGMTASIKARPKQFPQVFR
jgi:hypothetical protein